eukprot:1684952-Alexandrium_andersonii.AAC.1
MSFRAGRFIPAGSPELPGGTAGHVRQKRALPESLPGCAHVTQGPPLRLAGPPRGCAAGSCACSTATRQ